MYQLMHFYRGKILYAPTTNATENIMKNINGTFQWIEKTIVVLHAVNEYLSVAKDLLLDNAVALETIKVILIVVVIYF